MLQPLHAIQTQVSQSQPEFSQEELSEESSWEVYSEEESESDFEPED